MRIMFFNMTANKKTTSDACKAPFNSRANFNVINDAMYLASFFYFIAAYIHLFLRRTVIIDAGALIKEYKKMCAA